MPDNCPLVISDSDFQGRTHEYNKITLKFQCLKSFLPFVVTYTYTAEEGEHGVNDIFIYVKLLDYK
jgi:hypothetical protein